jgi:hypothetical protein
MGIFDKEIAIIGKIPGAIELAIKETVQSKGFVLKSYNIQQLKDKGENAVGKKLKHKRTGKTGYTNPYKRKRIKAGLQVAYVDTRFSGVFHAQIEIIAEDGQLRISSTIDYSEYIIRMYGAEVLGVQRKYLEDFTNKHLLTNVKKAIDDQLTKS